MGLRLPLMEKMLWIFALVMSITCLIIAAAGARQKNELDRLQAKLDRIRQEVVASPPAMLPEDICDDNEAVADRIFVVNRQ